MIERAVQQVIKIDFCGGSFYSFSKIHIFFRKTKKKLFMLKQFSFPLRVKSRSVFLGGTKIDN